jgi:hypothetical protein
MAKLKRNQGRIDERGEGDEMVISYGRFNRNFHFASFGEI